MVVCERTGLVRVQVCGEIIEIVFDARDLVREVDFELWLSAMLCSDEYCRAPLARLAWCLVEFAGRIVAQGTQEKKVLVLLVLNLELQTVVNLARAREALMMGQAL